MAEQAQKKTRTSARKIKDRWKAKGWYNILAPEMFNKQLLGETIADEPGKVMGRIAEVTVQDLTGDFSKMHIKLQFKVHHVQGQDALTQFIGHDMTSDYVRRLTRRKRTRTVGGLPRRPRGRRGPGERGPRPPPGGRSGRRGCGRRPRRASLSPGGPGGLPLRR